METPRISIGEVGERIAKGQPVAFVDTRSAKAYATATEQLPGSRRISPDADVRSYTASLPRDAVLVAYCT
jgi:hypothetical protein